MSNLQQAKDADANSYREDNVTNIRRLQKHNLPYLFIWVIYYAWVIVFSTWWMASPVTESVFGTDLRVLMHSVNLISSAIFIFVIRKEWFVKTARVGGLLLIAAMILYLSVQNTSVKQITAVAIGISLGCVNISILIPFVFVLNNTEKLYAVVGSNLLIYVSLLLKENRWVGHLQSNYELLLSFVTMGVALSAVLFFNGSGLPVSDKDNMIESPEFRKRIYLTLFFNCIVAFLCKGAGKGMINLAAGNLEYSVLLWYYLGGVAGCFLYIAIYRYNSKPFVWLGNITFSSFAMGLFCNAFVERNPAMIVPFSILLGISSAVGMINIYYIMGVVGKKYNSMRYLRLSIFFIGICGGISGIIIGNLIQRTNTFEVSMFASIFSVAIMLVFIMLSPQVSQSHYYDDWAKDSEKTEIDNEQLYMFKKYKLSKRETEVCKLLLQGYTMRQISGILSIAYSTVNTYCTSTYRKLSINSRTELLILFKDYEVK